MSAADTAEVADAELVRRAQGGDLDAFAALVERNQRAVFRAAVAAVGSRTEADDIAQEVFVTAFQKLSGFRGDAAFRTWLLAITWRKAIDRRKTVSRWMRRIVSQAPRGDTREDWTLVEALPSRERSQEDSLLTSELQQQLRRLIATLPRKLRDGLLLAGSGDYSYEQIAQMLRIPVGTVKWRVSEARKLLRQKMAAGRKTEDGRQKTEE